MKFSFEYTYTGNSYVLIIDDDRKVPWSISQSSVTGMYSVIHWIDGRNTGGFFYKDLGEAKYECINRFMKHLEETYNIPKIN